MMNNIMFSPLARKNFGIRSTFHSFPRHMDLAGPGSLNFLYSWWCERYVAPWKTHFKFLNRVFIIWAQSINVTEHTSSKGEMDALPPP